MSIRHKLVLQYTLILAIPTAVYTLLENYYSFYIQFLFYPFILGLSVLYLSGLITDLYIKRKGTVDNDMKSTIESRIFRVGYVGLSIGVLLFLLPVVQCLIRECNYESIVPLFYPIIPVFFYAFSVMVGLLWNFRWGRPIVYILMIIPLFLLIVLIYGI